MEKNEPVLKNYILLISNSRNRVISKCIESIMKLERNNEWKKIHIHQEGHELTTKQFDKYQKYFDINIRVKPIFQNKLANINFNRILGYRMAFELMGADNVLGIEEDTIIAKDALNFSSFVLKRYSTNTSFRGINLASGESKGAASENSYSLLRFGIQGQGSLITRKTWEQFPARKLLNYDSGEGWDSPIEFYLKTGFMITPNFSRILDFGWDTGTHTPKNKNDDYYINMKTSFLKVHKKSFKTYDHEQIEHKSRLDLIAYKTKDNLIFYVRHKLKSRTIVLFLKTFMTKKLKSRFGVRD